MMVYIHILRFFIQCVILVKDHSLGNDKMAEKLANAGALGLSAFGVTTLCMMLLNTKMIIEDGAGPGMAMVLGIGMFFGGLIQVLVGWQEWKSGNTFGATAFTSYGAFWLSFCMIQIYGANYGFNNCAKAMDIPADSQVSILRFANRVPLLFQPGSCAITQAVANVDWRRYGLEQRGGKGIPFGPAIFLVHIASTKVPFTSEGKEAVADFPEIVSEIELALKLCARSLKTHLNKEDRRKKTHAKFEIVHEILPEFAERSAKFLDRPVPNLDRTISKIMNVVWIEPTVKKDKKKRVITYTIYNYTTKERTMCLHAQLPKEAVNLTLFSGEYFTEMNDDGKVTWTLNNIPAAKHVDVTFELTGEMADVFSPDDIYISGINPVIVMGADQLPGDWGIKGMEITEMDSDYVEDDTDAEAVEEVEDLGDE